MKTRQKSDKKELSIKKESDILNLHLNMSVDREKEAEIRMNTHQILLDQFIENPEDPHYLQQKLKLQLAHKDLIIAKSMSDMYRELINLVERIGFYKSINRSYNFIKNMRDRIRHQMGTALDETSDNLSILISEMIEDYEKLRLNIEPIEKEFNNLETDFHKTLLDLKRIRNSGYYDNIVDVEREE